jgi:molybdopterin converting factor small subunit
MRIEVEYGTQVRAASGMRYQTLELAEGDSLKQLLAQLVSQHPALCSWLDLHSQPRGGLLVFVNDKSPIDYAAPLREGDEVSLLTLVSGG